jgi:uncharacterized protein
MHRHHLLSLALASTLAACASPAPPAPLTRLAGDWDVYHALGTTPADGFEGWRRTAYAHFPTADSNFLGAIRSRTGLSGVSANGSVIGLTATSVHAIGTDSVVITGDHGTSFHARWHNDTLTGVVSSPTGPEGRWRLVRRTSPAVAESNFPLWPGPLSDSAYKFTEDTLVYMRTRGGARLASYIARPIGPGPFGVVLLRTPYGRVRPPMGRYWASHGYIFIGQDVRGRDLSDGNDFGDYDTDVTDGYDAVEWAAKLPGANGRVGMVGHSDEGRLAWYAALDAPPHLAALAPSAASSDPWRISPYEDMVFAPINVAWACLMRARTLTAVDDLPIGSAMRHLPVAGLPQFLGCGNIPLWNRWLAHKSLDAYWRAHAVTTHIGGVRAPVLQMTGWYDDSRGPIDYTNALSAVPNHPPIRLVIGPGAHQGVDHVAGVFGPESRIDERQLQLRWFDHYLRGVDNGVDREPPVDYFVIGDNHWHHAAGWPPAHVTATRFFLHSHGHANTSAGDGWLDTLPPGAEPHDEYRYDPSDPTPYLIDSRELETSLNEDFASLDATRPDELVFTSPPLTQPLLVAGPLSASLYAATDARDTDWYVMLLDVFPDGRAERVQDGVARARFRRGFSHPSLLTPGQAENYRIDMWFTGRVFEPGHRVRVVVSSALFPKYDRNLNTGGDNERDTTWVVAHQTILHDAAHPSEVVLGSDVAASPVKH